MFLVIWTSRSEVTNPSRYHPALNDRSRFSDRLILA
jgi:hypothetical protein